jgi:hypothetical protein
VAAGEPLELFLELTTPRPIHGHGLRLRVESALEGQERRVLLREEAVLAGRPREGWLATLKLTRPPAQRLLGAGRHRFHLRLDTQRLLWRGPAPDGRLEPQRLKVELVLEARGSGVPALKPKTVLLLDGRTLPQPLPDASAVPTRLEVPALPPAQPGWGIRPVVGADVSLPLAVGAARYEREGDSIAVADLLDVQAEVTALGSALRVRGQVRLDLRHELRGEVVVQVEMGRSVQLRWRSYGRETLLLARGGPEGAGGAHLLEFEYVAPTAFAKAREGKRRLSVWAELRGEGRPLRSDARKLVVASAPPRGR